jgi:biotin carboxyl carrier protein
LEFRYQIGDEIKSVRVERAGDEYQVTVEDRVYQVSIDSRASGEMILLVNGSRHSSLVARNGSTRFVAIDGRVLELVAPETGRARRRHHHGEDSLTASMPGQVRQVLVAEGDAVERGQTLVILEAMKMEIRVAAPHAGRVAQVAVREGEVVDRGQVLVELAASVPPRAADASPIL